MAGPATLYQAGDHASRPANGSGCVLYSCTDHDLVYRDDGSSWTTFMTLIGGAGGDVATDTIWDAAGDLAVGSGANTAARLAIGAAGGALSRVNGAVAWNSGTGFPTAATGDRYWRTDLGKEFYYDGTRWLTVHELELVWITRNALSTGLSASTTIANAPTRMGAGDMYLTRFEAVLFANATNDGSNYWELLLEKLTAGNVSTTIHTLSTVSNTAANWIEESANINAVVSGSAHTAFRLQANKIASPGSLVGGVRVKYREVG